MLGTLLPPVAGEEASLARQGEAAPGVQGRRKVGGRRAQ